MGDLRRLTLVLLAVLVAPVVAGCAGSADQSAAIVVGGDDDGYHGAVLTEPYEIPPTELTDTHGKAYSLAGDTDTPVTLVFFGYTHCPDICQLVMSTIASSLHQLDADVREQVGVVFVTTDPERDDEATLRAYLDRFDPSFVGLTGDLADIEEIAEAMGVFLAKGQTLPDGGYEVDHSTPVIGVRDDGTAPIVWTQGTSAGDLAEDVAAMVDAA